MIAFFLPARIKALGEVALRHLACICMACQECRLLCRKVASYAAPAAGVVAHLGSCPVRVSVAMCSVHSICILIQDGFSRTAPGCDSGQGFAKATNCNGPSPAVHIMLKRVRDSSRSSNRTHNTGSATVLRGTMKRKIGDIGMTRDYRSVSFMVIIMLRESVSFCPLLRFSQVVMLLAV